MAHWIYVRVSTKEQAADGSSLVTQAKECREYVKRNGFILGEDSNYGNPGVFADPGVSAWRIPLMERPGFKALWLTMKPGDTVIMISLDRGFRSVLDFTRSVGMFEQAKINMCFIMNRMDMSKPMGRLVANIAASFAQFKSDMISQRVSDSHKARKARLAAESQDEKNISLKQEVSPLLIALTPDEPGLFDGAGRDNQVRGRVFGYVRVSTSQQDEAYHDQMLRVTSAVNRMCEDGYTLGAVHGDLGVSAFCVDWGDRPGGERLFREVQPGDVIVVSAVDRAFRSIQDMADRISEFQEIGIHLVTCDGIDTRDPMSRNAIEILGLMAEWESRDLSWRMLLMHKNRRKLYGRWSSPKLLPLFLKSVFNENRWTAHPKWSIVSQCLEVMRLRDQGISPSVIANIMERQEAAQDGRCVLPICAFSYRSFVSMIGKSGITADQMAAFNEWSQCQKTWDGKPLDRFKDKLCRFWTERKVRKVLTRRLEIVTMLEHGVKMISGECG